MAITTEVRVLPVRKVAWDFTFAFWALRLWLGFRALFVGIQKYAAYKSVAMPLIDPSTGQPDASGVMVNVSVKSYALANYAGMPASLSDKFAHDPLFPKFALTLFDRMLGPALILTGIMYHHWFRHTAVLAHPGAALHRVDNWPGSDRCERRCCLSWHPHRSGSGRVFARPAQQVCGV